MDKENQPLLLSEFDFDLPHELIAQTPLLKRDTSRLLVLNRQDQSLIDDHFYNLKNYLKKGDILVRNNSKVLPARLFGYKQDTKAHVEILLLKQKENNCWECLVKGSKKVKKGTIIIFDEKLLQAEILEKKENGLCEIKMIYEGILIEILEKLGTMPLPPYIKEKLKDQSRYQTVYAKIEGSAAAPTAGLHFSEELLEAIIKMGVEVVDVTLHVGLGTFRPVEVDKIIDHHMHEEYYVIEDEVAKKLNQAKQEGRRIIGIGTTSCRVLETNFRKHHQFVAEAGTTNIFIYPGQQILSLDGLVTNFHLPKSTLIMLVSTFASKELIFKAYYHAIEEKYRFFSFGDAMLIL